MRRKAGIILAFLLTATVIFAGYMIRKEKRVVVVDPWLAVPSDAFIIIETPDFPELLTNVTDRNGIIARLSGMKWAASVERTAAAIDSITGSRELRELVNGRRVIVSFHSTGQSHFVPLVAMSTAPSLNVRHLAQMISRSGATTKTASELGGTKSLSATYGKGMAKTTVHLSLASGVMILSTSETLVANALNNMSSGSDIRHQQGFAAVAGASGKEAENIYILFRNLPRMLQTVIRPEEVMPIVSAAIAAGGDISSDEDGLSVSGFLSTSGPGLGAGRLSVVTPSEPGVHEVLPEGTLSYRTIMSRPALSGTAAPDASSINATDIALALTTFTENEVTVATIRTDTARPKVILFRMTDREKAASILEERLRLKYRSMGLGERHYLSVFRNKNNDEVQIFRMPFTGVAALLSGEATDMITDSWVTFCRSYMIFSSHPDILALISNMSDSESTLINDPGFRDMEQSLPTKGSYYFYISGSAMGEGVGDYLLPALTASMNDNTFSGIDGMGLCLSPSGEMIYTSLSFRYNDNGKTVSNEAAVTPSPGDQSYNTGETARLPLTWKTRLHAPMAIKPFFFTNHNTGATEIFTQDTQNNIYLLSGSGKILWEAKIREQIRGDIFMIDYYKNGKNQLLFAGKEYLHLIDRNGNYVDRFPVKLRSPATNNLAVFDYENNRDYRLCIAGEDRKVHIYDRSGVPVKGWNLFTTKGRVTSQVVFFRVKGKDYLVVTDDQSVYILDRTGNIRVNLKEPVIRAKESAIRLQTETTPSIIFTAPDGTVTNTGFDGTVTRSTIRKFSPAHSFDLFDIDSDGRDEYLYVDEGTLYAFDDDHTALFKTTFETTGLAGPYRYVFSSSDRKVGVYDRGKKDIYLLNSDGEYLHDFPIQGEAWFAAGKLSGKSTWSFIYGSEDGYIYNVELRTGF